MTEATAIKREVFLEISDRLDKLLSDVAIVLPPPKITQQQALQALCNDKSPEGLESPGPASRGSRAIADVPRKLS